MLQISDHESPQKLSDEFQGVHLDLRLARVQILDTKHDLCV